jgi:hypothetical protein
MRIKNLLIRLATVVVTAAVLAAVALSWAASAAPTPTPPGTPGTPTDLNTVINNLVTVITSLVAGLATVALTIGGVMYLTAGGDPEQVSKAKTALKNAAIGYGVVVLAPLLVTILKKVVGA